MKRKCTEEEKRIIFANRKSLCTGLSNSTASEKTTDMLIAIVLGVLCMVGILVLAMKFDFDLDFLPDSEYSVEILFLLLVAVIEFIVTRVLKKIRASKQRKRFMKATDMYINGATIIETVNDSLGREIYFVEDDEKDIDGRPYVIGYPASATDIKGVNPGDRLILVYGVPAKSGRENFQIMKVSKETEGLIPVTGGNSYKEYDRRQLKTYPHPAMKQVVRGEHILTEDEKTKLADVIIAKRRKSQMKVFKITAVIEFICINFIITMLAVSGEIKNPPVPLGTAGVFIIANAAIVLFFLFLKLISRRTQRKNLDFVSVKEVLFKSEKKDSNYMAYYCVYEWNEASIQQMEYTIVEYMKAEFGDILYRVKTKNGQYMLLEKKICEGIF